MLEIRKANERGYAEHGWLSSWHTFSFARYHEPTQVGFSDLLVINEDIIQPNKGFGMHSHRDMEIFSYVLAGALEHKDSMGNGSTIRPGDVQIMSAGTGVSHSEFNPLSTTSTHLLQIWLVPASKGITPRYQEVHFPEAEKRGKLKLIISEQGENGSLSIHQDIRIYAGLLTGAESATLNIAAQRYAYVHVAKGSVQVNQQRLNAGDSARVRNERLLAFTAAQEAEILVFDLRERELPDY